MLGRVCLSKPTYSVKFHPAHYEDTTLSCLLEGVFPTKAAAYSGDNIFFRRRTLKFINTSYLSSRRFIKHLSGKPVRWKDHTNCLMNRRWFSLLVLIQLSSQQGNNCHGSIKVTFCIRWHWDKHPMWCGWNYFKLHWQKISDIHLQQWMICWNWKLNSWWTKGQHLLLQEHGISDSQLFSLYFSWITGNMLINVINYLPKSFLGLPNIAVIRQQV